mgnify:CR=1 FL=1
MSEDERRQASRLSRRDVLKIGAVAGVGASIAALGAVEPVAAASAPSSLNEKTVVELQGMMSRGELTAVGLLQYYLRRIRQLDQDGPRVNSIIELNPDALASAAALDRERREKGPRGPLPGIPILLKDNIDTHDRTPTASGSLARVGIPPP